MEITPLKPFDKNQVIQWLESYLQEHLVWWAESFGLEWSDTYIIEHIQEKRLVFKAWDRIQKAVNKSDAFVRVARLKNKIVGIVQASLESDDLFGYNIGQIQWIFVDHNYRGRGCGQLLMKAAQTWLFGKDPIGIELYVNQTNKAGKSFYQKLGYSVSDERMLLKIST